MKFSPKVFGEMMSGLVIMLSFIIMSNVSKGERQDACDLLTKQIKEFIAIEEKYE